MHYRGAPHYDHSCCPRRRVRHLDSNGLSGTIPTSLGSMKSLTELYVQLRDVMKVGDELRGAAK